MKWLIEGKPGGHKTMEMQDSNLINAYDNYLKIINDRYLNSLL